MSLKASGLVTVTTAGTPVRITTTSTPVQSVLITAFPTNAGLGYVCDRSDAVRATGVGIVAVIGKPSTDEVSVPSFQASIPLAPAGLNLSSIWIDADDNGAKFYVSYTEQ